MQENFSLHWGNFIKRQLPKSLLLTTLTGASLILGTLAWSAMANNTPAVKVTNVEVTNYAKSVLEIERIRQEAFGDIKKLIEGGNIPQIVCNEPKSIESLPNKAKVIAVKYCNDSQQVVVNNRLSIERFNEITIEIQTNNKLNRQIYKTLIRLQNESTPKSQ